MSDVTPKARFRWVGDIVEKLTVAVLQIIFIFFALRWGADIGQLNLSFKNIEGLAVIIYLLGCLFV